MRGETGKTEVTGSNLRHHKQQNLANGTGSSITPLPFSGVEASILNSGSTILSLHPGVAMAARARMSCWNRLDVGWGYLRGVPG